MIAMVSNMRFLQSSVSAAWPPGCAPRRARSRFDTLRLRSAKCNMGAATRRRALEAIAAALLMFGAAPVSAQSTPTNNTAQPNGHPVADTVKFLAGGALGLGMHETGHLLFDEIFDAHPRVKGVHFGPFPFFAITHRPDLSPRREFTVSSAGFWVQQATNEWILTRHPNLRDEHAPLTKGLLTFNVL